MLDLHGDVGVTEEALFRNEERIGERSVGEKGEYPLLVTLVNGLLDPGSISLDEETLKTREQDKIVSKYSSL